MNRDVAAGLRTALDEAARGDGAVLGARLGLGGLFSAMGWDDRRSPEEVLWARLEHEVQRECARSASTALREAGLAHCAYKGAAVRELYAPDTRSSADVDLLVDHGRLQDALRALSAVGVVVAEGAWHAAPPAMRRSVEMEWTGGVPVAVDLAWALVHVNRLLSDAGHADLDRIWSSVRVQDGITIPEAAVHWGLIVHHLVHHDLGHAPGLVDTAVLWSTLDDAAMHRAAEVTRWLGVARVAEALVGAFVRRLGPLGPTWPGRRYGMRVDLAALLRAAGRGGGPAITVRRALGRARLLDRRRDAWRLVRDVVAPPAAHLKWRWPDSPGYASRWVRHAALTMRKLIIDP